MIIPVFIKIHQRYLSFVILYCDEGGVPVFKRTIVQAYNLTGPSSIITDFEVSLYLDHW